jgi:hypothetical protein
MEQALAAAATMYPGTHTYRPRKPQQSPYYQCVEDHFETFEQVYDEQFNRRYGFFRS